MYTYQPIEFNGNSLEGGNFTAVWFDPENGPVTTPTYEPIEAEVIGLGDRDVRAQPKGAYWELHCILRTNSQADRDTFLTVFDEEAGLVTLKMRDSTTPAAKTWRVTCRVVGTRRIGRAWGHFIAVLRVADPTLREDTATIDTQLAMVGNQQLFTLTNAGNRKVRPTFTIEPQAGKDDPFDAHLMTMKGLFHPPPTGRPTGRYPVDVIDNPAHTTNINHESLVRGTDRADVSGALTAAATSIPYDTISNGGPTTKGLAILQQARASVDGVTTAIATSIAYDAAVNGNPPTSGVVLIGTELIRYTGGGGGATGTLTGCTRGYANTVPASHADGVTIAVMEQISYTAGGGGAPGTLTGVVRGVGGTNALAHSDNTNIHASSLLLNGGDVRVKVNNQLVQAYVAGCLSTADFRTWISTTAEAHKEKTLYRDISNSADVIAFNEGVADMPPAGLLAIYDHVTREHEIIFYTGRFIPYLALTGCIRGLWGTTARAHSTSEPVNLFTTESDPYAHDPTLPGDFEKDDEAWTISGGGSPSVARTTEQRKFGEASLEVATGTDVNAGPVSPVAPADASTEYTFSVWIRRTESSVPVRIIIRDQDSNVISTGSNIATTSGAWFRVEITFTTGAGDTGVEALIAKNSDATNITYYLDGAQFEIGATTTPFGTLDGHADSPVFVFEVFAGKADAEPPDAPPARRPAIGLHQSRNDSWSWGGYGTRTFDRQSVFYNRWKPLRPASWLPYGGGEDDDRADYLRLESSGDKLQWVDKDKKAGKQLTPNLVLALPAGVNDFESDVQKRSDIRLRAVGVDVDEENIEIVDEQDVEEPAVTTADVSPDDILYGLGLQGVRAAVTGNDEEDLATDLALPFAVYQRVVLWQKTKISAVQLRIRESNAASSMRFKIALFESHGIYPNTANPILEYDQAVGSTSGALTDADASFTFTGSELDHAAFETVEFKSSSGEIEIGPGVFWLKIETTVASASNGLVLSRGQARTASNIMYSVILGFNRVKPAWLRVIHEGGGPVSVDSALLNAAEAETNKEASFDGVKCDFQYPPLVEREDALATDRYHCTANIKNTQNGDEIDVDWWLRTGEQLIIDCEARTVTFLDANGNSRNALAAVTPLNVSDWMRLEADVNNMEFNDDGMVDTDLTSSWRGRKV